MTNILANSPDRRRVDIRPILAAIMAVIRLPGLWLYRARVRRELAGLDADQMRDVGLTAVTVRREADKPFWRA